MTSEPYLIHRDCWTKRNDEAKNSFDDFRCVLVVLGLHGVVNRSGLCRGQTASDYGPHYGGRYGLFRHRQLRRRDRNAAHRSAGDKRLALHAVLQRGPLLSHASVTAHGFVSAPGRNSSHGGQPEAAAGETATIALGRD